MCVNECLRDNKNFTIQKYFKNLMKIKITKIVRYTFFTSLSLSHLFTINDDVVSVPATRLSHYLYVLRVR